MKISKRWSGGIMPFAIALALSLAAFMSEAKAASISLGSLSSASGSVVLNNGQAPTNNLDLSTDTYSFTLTDAANVSGLFDFNAIDGVSNFSMDIDVNSIAGNLVHTTAVALHFDFSVGLVMASPGLFSLDLTPGNYVLALTGGRGPYSGTLAFAPAIATTPIPAALPLFAAALSALGFVGWRRKQRG